MRQSKWPLQQLILFREKRKRREEKKKAENSESIIGNSIFFIVLKFGSGLAWHPMESEDSEPLSKKKYSDLFKEQRRWLERWEI